MGAERSQPTEKRGGETVKIQKKTEPGDERRKKNGQFPKSGLQKKSRKKRWFPRRTPHLPRQKPRFPEKSERKPDLGGLSSGGKKSQTESSIPQTDGNVKILEIEPINFLLEVQGTAGHYLQLYQLLKDQPCQTPDQDDLQKSRHQ